MATSDLVRTHGVLLVQFDAVAYSVPLPEGSAGGTTPARTLSGGPRATYRIEPNEVLMNTLAGRALRDDIGDCPVANGSVSFLLIGSDGTMAMDNTKTGKRELLTAFDTGDRLLLAWTGQWKTDIFNATDQVDFVREQL